MTATTAGAKWNVDSRVDSMTDRVTKIAQIQNNDGHVLKLYLKERNPWKVWGIFRLNDSSFDSLSPKTPPLYRIDDFEPRDVDLLRRLEEVSNGKVDLYEWQPKWVQWQIYGGENEVATKGTMCQLLIGSEVTFRYYLATGGYKETTFTLEGSREAIKEATGVRVESNSC
jgi:hypothetical protein